MVVYPCSVDSGVGYTPWGRETKKGAKNRATKSFALHPQVDLAIGLESGLVNRYGDIYEEAWACVLTGDKRDFFGYSSGLKVPTYIIKKLNKSDLEHWQVMQQLEEEFHYTRDDTWGNYSGNIVLRNVSLEEALRNALIQIFAPPESLFHK